MNNQYYNMKRDDLVEITLGRIYKTYHQHWNLSEDEFPIHDNTYFITCRHPVPNNPNMDLINGYLEFNAKFLRQIIRDRDRTPILNCQHVGIFAADYEGSRRGYASEGRGAHIHAVWVIHPILRQEFMSYMQLLQFLPKYGFHRLKIDRTESDLKNMISYCLKGIMNENGFYKGRSSQFEFIGPKHNFYSKI